MNRPARIMLTWAFIPTCPARALGHPHPQECFATAETCSCADGITTVAQFCLARVACTLPESRRRRTPSDPHSMIDSIQKLAVQVGTVVVKLRLKGLPREGDRGTRDHRTTVRDFRTTAPAFGQQPRRSDNRKCVGRCILRRRAKLPGLWPRNSPGHGHSVSTLRSLHRLDSFGPERVRRFACVLIGRPRAMADPLQQERWQPRNRHE